MNSLSKLNDLTSLNDRTSTAESPSGNTEETSLYTVVNMLKELRLNTMAEEFLRLQADINFLQLPFKEQLYELVSCEYLRGNNSGYQRRLKRACLRSMADKLTVIQRKNDYRLSLNTIDLLMSGQWRQNDKSLLILGGSGVGKTDLASAILNENIRTGLSGRSYDYSLISSELCHVYNDVGPYSYKDKLKKLVHFDVILLDDAFIGLPRKGEGCVLKDLIDACKAAHCNLIVASQTGPKSWHAFLGGDESADAALDRLLSDSFLIELEGQSHRSHQSVRLNEAKEHK